MRRAKARTFEAAFFVVVLTSSASFPVASQQQASGQSSVIAPPLGITATGPLSQSPAFDDAKDAQMKTTALIDLLMMHRFGSLDARDSSNFPRAELKTALQNLSQVDRAFIFKKLMETISVNKKPRAIGSSLLEHLLSASQLSQSVTADAFQSLFRSILLVGDKLTDIINSVELSKAHSILRKSPEEQGLLLRGMNDIPDKDPTGKSRQRTSLLNTILEKNFLRLPKGNHEGTKAKYIIEMLEAFRLIPMTKLGEYYRFIQNKQPKVFPEKLKQEAFAKLFKLFYASRDYENLIHAAVNNTLISPRVALEPTISILHALNEVDSKEQDEFISLLDEQFLLSKGMNPENIACVLGHLKNVPLSDIPSIRQELIRQRIIGTGWSGEQVAPLIHIISATQDQRDAYTRLLLIKDVSSPKFQHDDFQRLHRKLNTIETTQLKIMILSFLRYFKSVQQWSASDTFLILKAISTIPTGYNTDILLQAVKVKIEVSENDKSARAIAEFIKEAMQQPQSQFQQDNQQEWIKLLTPSMPSDTPMDDFIGNTSQQSNFAPPPPPQPLLAPPPQQNSYPVPQQSPQQQSFTPLNPQPSPEQQAFASLNSQASPQQQTFTPPNLQQQNGYYNSQQTDYSYPNYQAPYPQA